MVPQLNTPPGNQWLPAGGKWKAAYPGPITNVDDDKIWVGGTYDEGLLSIEDGVLTFDHMLPATDDPSIRQRPKLTLTFTFDGDTQDRVYVIDVPYANRPAADGGNDFGVNLLNYAQTGSLGNAVALYGIGVPGGLAVLSEDGTQVLDAYGVPIVGGGGGGGLTPEQIRDLVAGFLVGGTNITIVHDDAADTLTINSSSGSGGLTPEEIQDLVAAMMVAGPNVTVVYDDAAGTLTISSTGGGGGSVVWGGIGGTLSSQADLQDALDDKSNVGHSHPPTPAVWGTIGGSLTDQADLTLALDAKPDPAEVTAEIAAMGATRLPIEPGAPVGRFRGFLTADPALGTLLEGDFWFLVTP